MNRRSYHEYINFLCRTGGAEGDVNLWWHDDVLEESDIAKEEDWEDLLPLVKYIGKPYAYFCACFDDEVELGDLVPFLDGNIVVGFFSLDSSDGDICYDEYAGIAFIPKRESRHFYE